MQYRFSGNRRRVEWFLFEIVIKGICTCYYIGRGEVFKEFGKLNYMYMCCFVSVANLCMVDMYMYMYMYMCQILKLC